MIPPVVVLQKLPQFVSGRLFRWYKCCRYHAFREGQRSIKVVLAPLLLGVTDPLKIENILGRLEIDLRSWQEGKEGEFRKIGSVLIQSSPDSILREAFETGQANELNLAILILKQFAASHPEKAHLHYCCNPYPYFDRVLDARKYVGAGDPSFSESRFQNFHRIALPA